jgi:hypothetical protein
MPPAIADQGRFRWKKDWTIILVVFLVLRIIYSLLGAVTASRPDPEPLSSGPAFEAANSLLKDGTFDHYLVNPWMRWDTGWYLKIAALGYSPQDGTAAYQPLYPLLVRLLAWLTQDYLLSAILIASLAALAAMLLLYEVILQEGMAAPAALRSVFWLACFPTAFFLFAAYTDSLFLALVLGSWLAARKGRWLTAGLLGGLAALCRLQGVLLTPALLWLWLATAVGAEASPRQQIAELWHWIAHQEGWRKFGSTLRNPTWLAALLPAAATGVWMLVLKWKGLGSIPGNLLEHWGIRTLPPWSGIGWTLSRALSTPRIFVDFVNILALLAVLLVLLFSLRRIHAALSLYGWLTLALLFMRTHTPHILDSFSRYMLLIFPAFILPGMWKSRLLRFSLGAALFALQIFLLLGFLDWRWVA